MNDFVDSFAYWLADFYLTTTILLVVTLAVVVACAQPAKRLAVAKAAIVASGLLAALCAIPGWSIVSLGEVDATELAKLEPDARPPIEAQAPIERARLILAEQPASVTQMQLPSAMPSTTAGEISWRMVVLAAYLVGSAAIVLWLAAGAFAAQRLIRYAEDAPAELRDLMPSGAALALQQVSPEIAVPVALGVWQPRVLLPRDWLASRSMSELTTVLAHEAAHIRNGDLKWLAASRVLLVLLWAHPLYWRLRRQMRLDQEMLADAAAAEFSGSANYAEQLVAWARATPVRSRSTIASSVGLWESPSQLRRRISMLLDEHLPVLRECSRRLRWTAMLVGGLVAVGLSMVTFQPMRLESQAADAIQTEAPSSESTGGSSFDPLGLPVGEDELAGVVKDESGNPLAGVTVDAWTWFPGNETTSDANGRFTLKGLDAREPVELQFTKAGFCPRLFLAEPVGKPNWVVTLNSRTYLEGQVLDPAGRPVAGINLRATRGPFETPDGSRIGAVWTETETDSGGRYRIYLEPDTYELRVRRPGVGVVRHEMVVVREDDRRGFDLQLETGPTFRARVIDSVTREPVGGIRLFRWREPEIVGSSNEQGELEIENMLRGRYEFNVSADQEKSRFPDIAGDYARRWSPDTLKEWQRLDPTGSGEGFQRNFDGLEFDIQEGMKPVTIVVERGVTIRGQVIDPDGKPVTEATVAPAKTGSGNSLTGDTRYSVRTDAEGKFEMRLPASGDAQYNLVAHDGDYQQWRRWANGVGELLQTKPGDELDDVRLQLSRPCIVRGRVLNASGEPVANHAVRAHSADKMENRYYDPTTKTDEEGQFVLEFVRPGKHYIQADPFWLVAEQGPPAGWRLVDTDPQSPVEEIGLRLE